MGRYYDEKISLDGLDPANPFFGPVTQAALNVDAQESAFYRSRRDLFNEMDFGNFNRDEVQVEFNYVAAIPTVSVWNYLDTFNAVSPGSYSGSGAERIIRDDFTNVEFSTLMPLADLYEVGEEDDDGNYGFSPATDVYLYTPGRGEPNVDTLFTNLGIFTSNSFISKHPPYFDLGVDAEDQDQYFPFFDVYEGFGEVPLHWRPKSGFSSQQLQIMYAAGLGYNSFVGPAINDFQSKYNQYLSSGGGNLDEDFYSGGTPNAPWQNFQGSSVSYNRPQNLPAALIKQARGL